MPFLGISWWSLRRCLASVKERSRVTTQHKGCLVGKYLDPIQKEIDTDYMIPTAKIWKEMPVPKKE